MNEDNETLIQAGYRYALSLRCQAADAEDLVQEAWLRLHAQLYPRINRARLLRTIRNIFIDRYRRDQLPVVEPLDHHEPGVEADATLLDREVSAAELNRELQRLRAPEREALFLNAGAGYGAAE